MNDDPKHIVHDISLTTKRRSNIIVRAKIFSVSDNKIRELVKLCFDAAHELNWEDYKKIIEPLIRK